MLPSKPILTVPSLYGGWPVRGGCVNSKQSSADLCLRSIILAGGSLIRDWVHNYLGKGISQLFTILKQRVEDIDKDI